MTKHTLTCVIIASISAATIICGVVLQRTPKPLRRLQITVSQRQWSGPPDFKVTNIVTLVQCTVKENEDWAYTSMNNSFHEFVLEVKPVDAAGNVLPK